MFSTKLFIFQKIHRHTGLVFAFRNPIFGEHNRAAFWIVNVISLQIKTIRNVIRSFCCRDLRNSKVKEKWLGVGVFIKFRPSEEICASATPTGRYFSFYTISNSARSDGSKSELPLSVSVGLKYLLQHEHSSKSQSP